MYQLPKDTKRLRARIRRYELELRKEYERFGSYDDSSGKRYLLGPLYMIAGDLAGAVRTFEWFEQSFPDDIGEPFHSLSWTLALYRSGNLAMAAQKLRQTMVLNLYLVPQLLGLEQEKLEIWHATNFAEKNYLQYAPPEILALWDDEALRWARETYSSSAFRKVRDRYIEIFRQLLEESPGPRRTQLVREAFRLQK